jgi:3-isopropylmalate/(R)-2-methylmalate dehydratase small subunit
VHKYGANVDTDVILPGEFLKETDPAKLAKHAMEGIDPEFVKRVQKGDFIVAGRNFGIGSSREHAPLALKHAGIAAVLAPSFARIFYRNAVDGGHLLPIEVAQDVVDQIQVGDELEISLSRGTLKNMTRNQEYAMKPFPSLIKEIVDAGGLFKYRPKNL